MLWAEYGDGTDGWDGGWDCVGSVRRFLIPHFVRNNRGRDGRDGRSGGWFDRLTTNGKEDAHCEREGVWAMGWLFLQVREADG